jgi:hypothetical protein
VVLRSMNELVDGIFDKIPRIHNLVADHTLCAVAFALGNPRIRHGVKGSAPRAKESPALWDCSCERHVGASVTQNNIRPEENKFQRR